MSSNEQGSLSPALGWQQSTSLGSVSDEGGMLADEDLAAAIAKVCAAKANVVGSEAPPPLQTLLAMAPFRRGRRTTMPAAAGHHAPGASLAGK